MVLNMASLKVVVVTFPGLTLLLGSINIPLIFIHLCVYVFWVFFHSLLLHCIALFCFWAHISVVFSTFVSIIVFVLNKISQSIK